jgi:hypothetical protein
MSEEIPNENLKSFESALGALVPTPPRIDRDQMFFRAGQASLRPRPWLWQGATGVLAVASAILAVFLAYRPHPEAITRIVHVPMQLPADSKVADSRAVAPTSEVTSFAKEWEDHRHERSKSVTLQEHLARWGLDALASPPIAARAEPRLTIENLLNSPSGLRKAPQPFNLENLIPKGGKS